MIRPGRIDAWLLVTPIVLMVYAYAIYPLLLLVIARFRQARRPPRDPSEWPVVSIVVPSYNEESSIRRTLESLLALDYPADRRQILVVSDASTDRTDAIVGEFADRGIELLRLPERSGKTAAENAARRLLRGTIMVNTDATIRILPGSLKLLIRVFQDPLVGVASGRDVSVGDVSHEGNQGESGYVGYEMWVRSLETGVDSIVGASGCFYAMRRHLHDTLVPAALSRDFASALIARENGYRAVSVHEAICLVPRTASLQQEYRRKVRTMARGLETLWYKRHLLDPLRYGFFAWMLWSHKLIRWLYFLVAPLTLLGVIQHALVVPRDRWMLALVAGALALGALAMRAPGGQRLSRISALCGFVLATHLAGFVAWTKALRGELNPIWEPTRRSV